MNDRGSGVVAAHDHSHGHRTELLESEICGCFYCLQTFPPSEIAEWIDEVGGMGTTALCPKCGIDSVLGSASGYALTADFLAAMNKHWF